MLSRSQADDHRHRSDDQPNHRKWHHHHREPAHKSRKMPATPWGGGRGATDTRRIDHLNYNNKNQRCQNAEPGDDTNLRTTGACVSREIEQAVDDTTHRIRPSAETTRRKPVHHKRKPSVLLILAVATVCIILATTTTNETSTTVASSLATLTAISPLAFTQWGSLTIAALVVGGGFSSLATIGDAAVVTTYEPSPQTEFKFQIVDDDDDADDTDDDDVDADDARLMENDVVAGALNEMEIDVVEREDADEGGDYRRYRNSAVDYETGGERRLRYRPPEIPLPPLNVFEVNVDFDDIEPTAGVVSTLKPHVTTDDKLQKKKSVTKRSSSGAGDDSTNANTNRPKELSHTSSTTPLASTSASTTATPQTGNSTKPTTESASGVNATEGDEKCEPKVLTEIPSEPYYDYTELIETAARQFTEFLANQFPAGSATNLTEQMRDEVRRKANALSTIALNEDTNLLAFAIAAPSIHTVVVKFRDNVTIPPEQVHNKGYLGSYWRELGFAWNSTENSQEWGAPFRDCNLLKGRWLWPFRLSFTEANIKIVAAAFIAADEDVCNDELEEIFGRRHGCDRNTTFCLVTGEGKPLSSRDAYTCICRETFYLPNSTLQGYRGDIVEESEGYNNYSCIPCPGGCTHCDQHGVCLLGEPQEAVSLENLLKVTVGSVLGACILCCVVLSVIVFRQRKCKAIASGMWTVLETILLGIVLLYASVAVHFFPASTERCLIEPWLRELGFITCYGAIILKLYRHLVDFRTRKAHRWVLRDVDLLKYLGTMIFAVICYMCAFTASSLDLLETGQLESLREVRTNTCLPMKWEYVTQASEILILCFGLHLSIASRNANTQFRERQFLVATLVLEFLVSTAFYTLRSFYLPEMSPGATFLALFLRSLLTNTIALGLIFVPKLWYQHKQVSEPTSVH